MANSTYQWGFDLGQKKISWRFLLPPSPPSCLPVQGWASKGGAPKCGAPKGGRPEISRFFSISRHHFRFFCLSLGVSWFSGGVWKRQGRQMFTFGVLGLSCEAGEPTPLRRVSASGSTFHRWGCPQCSKTKKGESVPRTCWPPSSCSFGCPGR